MSEPMEDQDDQVDVPLGPGHILKQARLAAGLSEKQMADKLRLKLDILQTVESDVLDESLSLTFSKGYIKLYAKNINVPEATVLEAFDKLHTTQKQPAKLQSFSRRVAKQANDDRLMLVTYIGLAVVVVLLVWWWIQQPEESDAVNVDLPFQQNDDTPSTQLTSIDIPEPALISGSSIEAANATDGGEITQISDETELAQSDAPDAVTTALEEDIPSNNEASQLAETASETSSQNEESGAVNLVFTFTGDCWVKLTDATGEDIAYGVKSAGRIMRVSGLPPFKVTLGAPHAVSIAYQGTNVDLSAFAAGSSANFTLPMDQE